MDIAKYLVNYVLVGLISGGIGAYTSLQTLTAEFNAYTEIVALQFSHLNEQYIELKEDIKDMKRRLDKQ